MEIDLVCSDKIKQYFLDIDKEVKRTYTIAKTARKKGLDPEKDVSIPLAKNMAERVVGLISVVCPKIVETTVTQRIAELEKVYGQLDWRVGLTIAEEVAKEKFLKFETKQEAIEIGIRTGFAYLTLGIVSAPLEGFIGITIKKRRDGREYLAIKYAGPIRGAGGTAASTSVILSDYVRVKMGYATYDPDEKEVNRYTSEVHDYHDRITNLQYHPSDEELKFMISHLPIEVDGDPTEKFEVSNYKDIPRIETNLIRGGMCLVVAEGLCQKAPKLWKRLSKWGKEMDLEWDFLGEFLKLKEEIHAKHSSPKKEEKKEENDSNKSKRKTPKPNNTFIMDLVAGRPILTYPMQAGGFRLRYGKNRTSGFSAAAAHSATLVVLDEFIAIGTQLKMERPGKGATITLCDTLEGPIVRLEDGNVMQFTSYEQAKKYNRQVEEILFLGDILFNYGDFSENGHPLVPAGYCEEWWALELEKELENNKPKQLELEKSINKERLNELISKPLFNFPSLKEAYTISKSLNLSLHPKFTCYWMLSKKQDVINLLHWLAQSKIVEDENNTNSLNVKKIILPLISTNNSHQDGKKILENIGVTHSVINKESIIIENEHATSLLLALGIDPIKKENSFENQIKLITNNPQSEQSFDNGLDFINTISSINIKDKAGTFIGARMGRPEKAKMRHLTGSPQVMFPVGEEGGRLRSFQQALKEGKIRSSFPNYYCDKCEKEMVYPSCEECHSECSTKYFCRFCGDLDLDTCRHGKAQTHQVKDINIKYLFEKAKERIGAKIVPDLIKGVRGTTNRARVVEHLSKGILRAKHKIYVNKDGTTRVDCTQLPLTHFKPKEIHTSVEKLLSIGYSHDIENKPLTNENQLLEIKPQDIILPGFGIVVTPPPKVLMNVANFVDDLLVNFYGLKPFYNIKKLEDLVGHLVIGLAPHISAGLIGRIIGYSDSQGLLTNPMYHAGLRRDCLDYNTFINIYNQEKETWAIEKIGEFADKQDPTNKLDSFGTLGKNLNNYSTLGYCNKTNKIKKVKINQITKHKSIQLLKFEIENSKEITSTKDHIFYVKEDNKIIEKVANKLLIGDKLVIPHNIKIITKDIKSIFIPNYYNQDDLMISKINIESKINKNNKNHRLEFRKKHGLKKHELDNFLLRKRWPLKVVKRILNKIPKNSFSSIKRDNVTIPSKINLNKEVLWLIGLYIAEGFSRKNTSKKGYYQVSLAATEDFIRNKIIKTCRINFSLEPSRITKDAIIYSSKLFYLFFTKIFECGSIAKEKRIPKQALSFSKNRLKYILQGYFDGDGSTDKNCLRVSCDTISKGLMQDLSFVFSRYNIYLRKYEYTSKPGKIVRDFYIKKNRPVPSFTITKLSVPSIYCNIFAKEIGFSLPRKQKVLLNNLKLKKPSKLKIDHDKNFTYLKIKSITKTKEKLPTYCLNVKETSNFLANNMIVHNCDGDEAAVMLLMDSLLNFSRKFLPSSRGSTMDAPLVLTSFLDPAEVDDQVHGVDVMWNYPLEFYEAALEMKNPWEVKFGPDNKKIEQLADRLGTIKQYEDFGFTHHVDDINQAPLCSAYKTLPSMREKLVGQMEIAKKVRAVDMGDVAKLVIQKHFLKDIKGNLRKYSMQQFRCVGCNTKYRRPPLTNKCSNCHGKIIFTISQGSVVKYLGPSLLLAQKYEFSPYLKQTLDMLQLDVDHIFGREKEKQVGLGSFIK